MWAQGAQARARHAHLRMGPVIRRIILRDLETGSAARSGVARTGKFWFSAFRRPAAPPGRDVALDEPEPVPAGYACWLSGWKAGGGCSPRCQGPLHHRPEGYLRAPPTRPKRPPGQRLGGQGAAGPLPDGQGFAGSGSNSRRKRSSVDRAAVNPDPRPPPGNGGGLGPYRLKWTGSIRGASLNRAARGRTSVCHGEDHGSMSSALGFSGSRQ